MIRVSVTRFVTTIVCLSLLGACSWFGGDDDEPEEIKPSPLQDINQEVELREIWGRKIGDGADDRALRIKPAVFGNRVFAAAADGRVMALQTTRGKVIWRQQVKDFYTKEELANAFTKDLDVITGGVGVGGDLVVVGAASGEVIAMNQSDGSLAWRVAASSEVLSAPQVDEDLVIVQTIDGKIVALDAVDGTRRWLYATSVPSLTLRGTSTPILLDNLVIAGFANGRVVFLDRERGLAGVDQKVTVAEGSSELERLIDIDGDMELVAGKLYAVSFQGRLMAIDVATGNLVWVKDASSVTGLGSGFGSIYLAHADSELTAFNADTGRVVWTVETLLHRTITTPVTVGSYVAVTDVEGYVHLLAQSDGRFVGRRKVDGDGVQAGLVVADGRLYAMGDSGKLSVLEIQ